MLPATDILGLVLANRVLLILWWAPFDDAILRQLNHQYTSIFTTYDDGGRKTIFDPSHNLQAPHRYPRNYVISTACDINYTHID